MVRFKTVIGKLNSSSVVFITAGVLILAFVTTVAVVAPLMQASTTLRVGDGVFKARLALDQASREKGLSGVARLHNTDAMILAFGSDAKWQIWMKDMKVPIDILWLDSNRKVIYIVKNASPDGGTDVMYVPEVDARYVVELAAGIVDSKAIRIGQTAVFDIKPESVK